MTGSFLEDKPGASRAPLPGPGDATDPSVLETSAVNKEAKQSVQQALMGHMWSTESWIKFTLGQFTVEQ